MSGDIVEGWKSISAMVNRSIDWCQRAAKRASDPLPVYYMGRDGVKATPCLSRTTFAEWVKRCEAAGASSSPIAGEG